jgi:ATP-binding cassette subfamily B protein
MRGGAEPPPDGAAAAQSSTNGHRPFTVDDVVRGVDRQRELRRTPQLLLDAVRIVWRACPRQMAATALLQLVAGAGIGVQLLIAKAVLEHLVEVSRGAPATDLYLLFALFTGVTVVVSTANAIAIQQQRLLSELVGRHAFDRIITVGSTVEYRRFETPDFHDELQRALASGEFRISDMVTGLSQLMAAAVTTVAVAVVLFTLEPLLLALILLAAVPTLVAALHNSRESHAFEYAMTPESRERAYVLQLMTSRNAAKEVRLFGLGSHFRRRYEQLTNERLRQLRIFLAKRLRVSLIGAFSTAVGMTIALGALAFLLTHDRIDVAAALTAGVAMQQLSARIPAITGGISKLVESGLFIEDYRRFLALPDAAVGDRVAPQAPAAAVGSSGKRAEGPGRPTSLGVEHVSFTYPNAGRPALDDVSLEVRPGEIVALVGENGSGKTTLVKLICQLYRPQSGRILWNGADAADLLPGAVASEATVLFQDYLQYHLSALDNVVFGRIDRAGEVEAAIAAARRSGADQFLSRLPSGYDTRLGLQFKGGHELSIGQWQRLSLARAFFRGGGLLILDEPTASLDPRAERDVFAQMRRLADRQSVLLISHRFSSVRFADRIYVLDNGRVTEEGSHDELVARGGHYAELFDVHPGRVPPPAVTGAQN